MYVLSISPLVENHCTEGMGMLMEDERKKKLGNRGGSRGGQAWVRLLGAGVLLISSDLWSSCVSASESPSLFWGERQVHHGGHYRQSPSVRSGSALCLHRTCVPYATCLISSSLPPCLQNVKGCRVRIH